MNEPYFINGLPLPAPLVRALESGAWQTPSSRDAWRSLFPDDEIFQPMLYPLAEMIGERSWLADLGPAYFGQAGEGVVPGDIDPGRSVPIGDLGPDQLIALDYRGSETEPSVVALTSVEHSNWRQVADNIEVFMRAIGVIS